MALPRLEGIIEEDDGSEEAILETSEYSDSGDCIIVPAMLRIADKLFVDKRKALNEVQPSSEALTILNNEKNSESLHYARGCHSILISLIHDNETSLSILLLTLTPISTTKSS